MSKHQIIYQDGKPAFAVVPWEDYVVLTGDAALSDEAVFDKAKAEPGEMIPVDVVDRLLAGENAVKVYREFRGLTQKQLAAKVFLNPAYLSQIETGHRRGSARKLREIADILQVDLDDLLPSGGFGKEDWEEAEPAQPHPLGWVAR